MIDEVQNLYSLTMMPPLAVGLVDGHGSLGYSKQHILLQVTEW